MSTAPSAASAAPDRRLRALALHFAPTTSHSSSSITAMAASGPKKRCPITSHILDTTLGQPAQGVYMHLEFKGTGGAWASLGRCVLCSCVFDLRDLWLSGWVIGVRMGDGGL